MITVYLFVKAVTWKASVRLTQNALFAKSIDRPQF